MQYPRIVIAATHQGIGKTTVTQGLILSLKRSGTRVQPFKAGPDYIDADFHSKFSNRISRNLDSMLIPKNRILELFHRRAVDADVSVIEGVNGLYDGANANDERGSTAHLAKIIKAPVILVMDVNAMARSAGALAYGFTRYEKNVQIAGFILNRVSNKHHYEVVKEAVEGKTGLPVFGYLLEDDDLTLPEHFSDKESITDSIWVKSIVHTIESTVDIDEIISAAKQAEPLPRFKQTVFREKEVDTPVRIAYAFDEAFHFYYQDNIDLLTAYGAELVPFSPLKDKKLPSKINGLYMSGGFPELFASELEKNKAIRDHIRSKAEEGMPLLAESESLIYCMEQCETDDREQYDMVGIFPGTASLKKRFDHSGYYQAELMENTVLGRKGKSIRGHLFYQTDISSPIDDGSRAFRMFQYGEKSILDGFVKNNVIASFMHIHFATDITWLSNFIKKCCQFRENNSISDV